MNVYIVLLDFSKNKAKAPAFMAAHTHGSRAGSTTASSRRWGACSPRAGAR